MPEGGELMATKAAMTIERARMILGWMLGWQRLDASRRASVEDYVALKLSCGRLAANRQIVKARTVYGPAAWDQAIQAGQVLPAAAATAKPVRPEQPKTPITAQCRQLANTNMRLVDFLRWLDARGRLQHLNPWNPEEWVAEFVGIDMAGLTAERKAILDYEAAMRTYWDQVERWRAAGGVE